MRDGSYRLLNETEPQPTRRETTCELSVRRRCHAASVNTSSRRVWRRAGAVRLHRSVRSGAARPGGGGDRRGRWCGYRRCRRRLARGRDRSVSRRRRGRRHRSGDHASPTAALLTASAATTARLLSATGVSTAAVPDWAKIQTDALPAAEYHPWNAHRPRFFQAARTAAAPYTTTR